MGDIVTQHDIGDMGSVRVLSAFTAIVAGGSGNDVLVNGITLDREGFNAGSLPYSAKFSVLFSTSLSASETLSLAFDVQTSPDGATWTDFATTTPTIVASESGESQTSLGVDLTGASRYVRCNFTPKLSNTATDTATLVACAFFAGFDRLPAL
jgi:hypothetical protein